MTSDERVHDALQDLVGGLGTVDPATAWSMTDLSFAASNPACASARKDQASRLDGSVRPQVMTQGGA
jgi:hypothetical protein